MISRETVLVASGKEVKEAFEKIASGEKAYVTAQELRAVSYMLCTSILQVRWNIG